MAPTTQSLKQLLADLHAERVRTWAPDALRVNVEQRRTLVETANYAGFVKPGDIVPAFDLPEVGGGTVSLDALLSSGPVVLVFFRFAGCPACNIALPYYQRELYPHLADFSATLIAVSPQVPERLVEIKRRHGLEFPIASDLDNALGRHFGILYAFDEASRETALRAGKPIGDVTGTGTWELPMPSVIVIGQDRRVHFADVAPDWLLRTEAEDVLAALEALSVRQAA